MSSIKSQQRIKEFTDIDKVSIKTLESLIHSDMSLYENNGYTLERIFKKTKGELRRATQSILNSEKPVIKIITGFYIDKAKSAETDGPSAAAQMTLFFKKAGIECCVVTDNYCEDICKAALNVTGCGDMIEVIDNDSDKEFQQRRSRWMRSGVTHVISIERPAPDFQKDIPHNMKGERIKKCLPLHKMIETAPWDTIGIGDRGNEIGFANIGTGVIVNDIPNGKKIASSVETDFLIASRVSNWASNALVAALSITGPKKWLDAGCDALCPTMETKIINNMVKHGAIDGITHRNEPTVDALPLSMHLDKSSKMVELINAILVIKTIGREDTPIQLSTDRSNVKSQIALDSSFTGHAVA